MTIKHFPLDRIEANPFQVRLAEDAEHVAKVALSIAHSGLLQTPVGRAHPAEGVSVAQLAFGHTRLAAYRRLRDEDVAAGGTGGEWLTLPVDVRELTDLELFELAIRENIDRKDLTPIEEARAMSTYREVFGKTSAQIGELFGLSDSAVRNRMRLLELPRPVQESVDSGGITENTARKLLTVQKVAPKQVEELAEKLVKGGYHDLEAIDFELDGVMEESAHVLCQEGGGRAPNAGGGLWKLDWKGGVEKPTDRQLLKMLPERFQPTDVLNIAEAVPGDEKTITEVIEAFASGTDVAGVVELFGIAEEPAAWIRQLVAPPPCSACEFHQVLNGVHYCGIKPCWEQKKAAWIASETRRIAKKLGIPVYDAAKDGKAMVSAPSSWTGTGHTFVFRLEPSWQKLLKAKDESLRLQGTLPDYREHVGTGSEIVELIRIGKAAEKAKAERKRGQSSSGIYDYQAKQKQWAEERRREEASEAFIDTITAPLFAEVLAPHENPEALQLLLKALRGYGERGKKLPEKRKERLAVLREEVAVHVLDDACGRIVKIKGPKATAKHLAGVAKTLGIRLPKTWDETAAALEPNPTRGRSSGKAGVSTETEEEG
jgi:ParB/RepB/Spo0J family partition protein